MKYVAVAPTDGLELAAGVAARAAEVALLDDPEPVAEGGLGLGELRGVDDLLGALLHDEDLVEERAQVLVLADLREQLGAEVGAVHRGDADRGRAVGGPVLGDLRGPLGAVDDDVLVTGDHVEPVPAAVDERLQRQLEGEGATAALVGAAGVDALRAAVGHRAVDGDRGAAADEVHRERDLGDDRPAPPVAGGERVEVGAERQLLALGDPDAAPAEDLVGVDAPRRWRSTAATPRRSAPGRCGWRRSRTCRRPARRARGRRTAANTSVSRSAGSTRRCRVRVTVMRRLLRWSAPRRRRSAA